MAEASGSVVGIAAALIAVIGIGGGYLAWQDFSSRSQQSETTLADLRLRVDGAASKEDLDGVAAQVRELKGSIAAVRLEVAALKQVPSGAGSREELTRVSQSLVALTEVVNAQLSSHDSLASKDDLDSTAIQIQELKSAISALQLDVAELEKPLPTTEDEPELARVSRELTALSEALDAHLTSQNEPTPSPESPDKAVAQLRAEILALLAKLPDKAALEAVAARGDHAAAELAARMAALNESLVDSNGSIDELRSRLSALSEAQASIDGRLNTLSAELDARDGLARGRALTLEGAVKDLRERLDQEIRRVEGLIVPAGAGASAEIEAKLDAMTLALAEFRSQLIEVEVSVAAAATVAALDQLRVELLDANTGGQTELIERVYFDTSSSTLAEDETQKLSILAEQLRRKPRDLAIVGFTDTTGQPEYNRALSLQRATAVRKALIERGIEASIVTSIDGVGEDGPPVITDDGSSEPANRTVMIYAYY